MYKHINEVCQVRNGNHHGIALCYENIAHSRLKDISCVRDQRIQFVIRRRARDRIIIITIMIFSGCLINNNL